MKYVPVFLHGGLPGAAFRAKLTDALPGFELHFYDNYAGFIENIETNKPPVIIIVPGNLTADEHQKMSAAVRFVRQSGTSVVMTSSVQENPLEDISIFHEADLVISESIGSEKWNRIISALIPDEEEKVQSLLQPDEEDLKDSKRQFSTLIENLPGIAYQCKNDQYWTMHFISKNVKQLTGYQADDLIDNKLISFSEIIFPEDREYVSETILNSVGKSKPFKLEYRIKTRQGGIKWVWEQGRIIRLKHKTESLLEGFIIDITERKMAEIRAEIMHNIAVALNATKDMSGLVKFIRDELGKVVNAKNFMLALYDEHKDELSLPELSDDHNQFENIRLDKTLSALVIRKNKSLLLTGSQIEEMQQKGKIEGFTSPAKSWLGVPLRVVDKVSGIIILQDFDSEDAISEYDRDLLEFVSAQVAATIIKKQSEDEIRKLLQSVEQNPNPIIITNKAGTIEYVNRKFTELSGFESSEVLGIIPHILDPKITDPLFCERIWDKILDGSDWHGEYFNFKKSGETYWELASISPIKNDDGTITHLIYSKEDITGRIKMEKDLVAAKIKAEESDKLKTAFLANMSHEIRTPMNAIIGFAEMLHEENYTAQEHSRFTKLIGENGRKLLSIIDDIIDIAKIESGQLNISTLRCSANKILFDNYYVFREIIAKHNKHNIELRTSQNVPDQNLQFISDPHRINQVIYNLMTNALKYTFQGFIELGYKLITINNKQNICFYVKDSGVGIPKEKSEIIFDRFRQIEENHTRVTGGAGLGLAISKNIARLMGGDITVDSEIGQGSTFYFTIPFNEVRSDEKYEEPAGMTRRSPNWADHSILIAEDEDSNFQLLDVMLRKSKVKVMRAYNGKEAVEFVRSGKDFDLVLMDVRMPVMNGYDATAAIKEINPNLPVVAQTAFALSGDREISINSGCDDYISKPIKSDELYRIISKFFV
jgi:PAS domain S-box-containing protein